MGPRLDEYIRSRPACRLHDHVAEPVMAPPHYAAIVLEKAMLRALIAAGGAITSLGYEGGDDVAELVARAEQAVFAIGARRQHQDAQAIREILKIQFREHRLPVPGEGARDRGGDGLQR